MAYKDQDKKREAQRQRRKNNPEYDRQWRKNNLDKRRETVRKFKLKNPDKVYAWKRQWIKNNLDKYRETARKAYHRNPGAAIEKVQRRRSLKKGVTVERLPNGYQQVLLLAQKFLCAGPHCRADISWDGKRKGYDIDHIVPLAKGGPHKLENLQLLCPPCNMSKGKKMMEEWLGGLSL